MSSEVEIMKLLSHKSPLDATLGRAQVLFGTWSDRGLSKLLSDHKSDGQNITRHCSMLQYVTVL